MQTSNPITTMPFDAQLNLAEYVGQRSATFRFELFDGITREPLGELTPLRDSVPVLTHDTSRTIKRLLTLELGTEDTARLDTIKHRVRVTMVFPDGREFPLGKYMPADDVHLVHTQGDISSIAFVDEMFILDQPLAQSFGSTEIEIPAGAQTSPPIARGDNVRIIMFRLLQQYLLTPASQLTITNFPPGVVSGQFFDVRIDPTQLIFYGGWPAGITGGKVLEDLSVAGDYFSPWFDNTGTLRIINIFEPASREADIDLDIGHNIVRESISRSNDLIVAPNRFIVIANSAAGDNRTQEFVGTYDVPSTAPHSFENRGFRVTDVREMQATSQNQVDVTARNVGIRETIFERVELVTSPDPRHDGYNVIRWDGELWLELGWSMNLVEGGEMRHQLRRAYL